MAEEANCDCLMNLGCVSGLYSEQHGKLLQELYKEVQVSYFDPSLNRENYENWSIPELGEHCYDKYCSLPANKDRRILTIPTDCLPSQHVVGGVRPYATEHKNVSESNDLVFKQLKESLEDIGTPSMLLHKFHINDVIQPVIEKFKKLRNIKGTEAGKNIKRPQTNFENILLQYVGLNEDPSVYRRLTDEYLENGVTALKLHKEYEMLARDISEEYPIVYQNNLVTKNDFLTAYKQADEAQKSIWIKFNMTTAHLSRNISADNLVIFPQINTVVVMSVFQKAKKDTVQMKAKIIELKLLQKYLPLRLGNMIDSSTRFLFILALPMVQDTFQFFKYMRYMRNVCSGCVAYILDANTDYTAWIKRNVLNQSVSADFSLDCLAVQSLGWYHYKELLNNTPQQAAAASEADGAKQYSIEELTETECRCKMNLGLCKFSTLALAPVEDPLIKILEPYPCQFLKGPSGSKDIPKQVMEAFNQSTRDMYLENFDKVIAIPPDFEAFDKSVVNQTDSPDEHNEEAISKNPSQDDAEQANRLKMFKTFHAEDIVYGKALHTLRTKGIAGFAMKNFHSAMYQLPLKSEANDLRSQHFSQLENEYSSKHHQHLHRSYAESNKKEKEVINIFKIDFSKRNEYIDLIINEFNGTPATAFDLVSKNLLKDIKKEFGADLKKFNPDFTKQYVDYMLYTYGLQKRSMEIDTFLVFPEEKLVMEIESKSATEDTNFGSKIKEAKEQLENFRQFFAATQSDILTEEWSFVKAIALPLIENIDSDENKQKLKKKGPICNYCRHFILDGRKLDVLHDWVESVRRTASVQQQSVNHEYRNLVIRMIGFSSLKEKFDEASLSLTQNRRKHEVAMIGTSSGLTNEHPAEEENGAADPICSLKTYVLWRLDQLAVLQSDYRRIILDGNYGTGKTYLLKSKAQQVAERGEGHVIYVSLTALKFPRSQSNLWREPKILEICDKVDLDGFPNIQVYGSRDVVSEYAIDNTISGKESFADMLSFVLNKPENQFSHVFIDEIPTVDYAQFVPFDLQGLETDENRIKDRYIWLAVRPQSIDSNSKKNVEAELYEWKEKMKKPPFYFKIPSLRENMRNAVNVCEFTKIFRDHKSFHTSSASRLPKHSVPGNAPVFVKVANNMIFCVRAVLEKYFSEDPDEPVVVLCTSRRHMDRLNADLVTHVKDREIFYFNPKISSDLVEDQENRFREFIKNPKGVLITDSDTFGGMQARNVIVLSEGGGTLNRNSVLRSTTSLVFITSVSGHVTSQAQQYLDEDLSRKLMEIYTQKENNRKFCKSILNDIVDGI